MDNLTYTYKPKTNQLDEVTDAAPDASAIEYNKYNDIKQGQADGNYQYDEIGNLISDASEDITNIEWTVYGKISAITKKDGAKILYRYDASGNRISKSVSGKETFYVRDAGGNVMSIYSRDASINNGDLSQTELHLYGSSRLGVFNLKNNVAHPDLNTGRIVTFTIGNKFFELGNHLGNVLATVSDKRLQHSSNNATVDYFTADVVSGQDYYPFGMLMPGRKYSVANTDYRYGFNGKENDNEIKGEGNQQDYGMRIYDPRLGRFLSVDPLTNKYPFYTPYQFAANSPILSRDIDGLESEHETNETEKKTVTDAGHGINGDSGASSGASKEAELALKLEEATSRWLGKFGVNNTRTREDYIEPGVDQIKYRLKKAKAADAEILVSFHLDWEKGRKYVNAVYQQSEESSKSADFETNSKKLAGLIIGELKEMNKEGTAKVVPVRGNTRFKTLGVLNGFNGNAATLIEFGSVGDQNNVQLINTNADEVGKQVATGMYKYLYGVAPTELQASLNSSDQNWHPPYVLPKKAEKTPFLGIPFATYKPGS